MAQRFFKLPAWVDPSLLTHANIPKPLHQVNPRSIRGQAWWNRVRREAYAVHDQRCWACGTHRDRAKGNRKWLEAHERYDIDYEAGTVTFDGLVALCPYCHQFIHSGRLFALWQKKEASSRFVLEVLVHGLGLINRYNKQEGADLQPFWFTKVLWFMLTKPMSYQDAYELMDTAGRIPKIKGMAKWEEWRLVLDDGTVHEPKFKTEAEWVEEFGDTNGFHNVIRNDAG